MDIINIVIADDHLLVRQGIKQIIELQQNIKVIGEASNGEEAINIIKQLNPQVALIDINMPVKNGIEVLKSLKESKLLIKTIMLTIHTEKEYLVEAVKLGADGYVLKDADSDILIDAINKVYNGESVIPSHLVTELIKNYRNPLSKNENELTEREIEVLRAISDGLSNKEIASRLFISEKTVKNHISNIFRKLDISDRTQAAIYAIKHEIK